MALLHLGVALHPHGPASEIARGGSSQREVGHALLGEEVDGLGTGDGPSEGQRGGDEGHGPQGASRRGKRKGHGDFGLGFLRFPTERADPGTPGLRRSGPVHRTTQGTQIGPDSLPVPAAQGGVGRFLTLKSPIRSVSARVGGRSSMVEPQIVILVVAGSSPVGHPTSPPAWVRRNRPCTSDVAHRGGCLSSGTRVLEPLSPTSRRPSFGIDPERPWRHPGPHRRSCRTAIPPRPGCPG